jgi:hypothetical protein
MGRLRIGGVVIASCLGLGLLGADSAQAETKTFTAKGCETWEVPSGVSSVTMDALGAAGQTADVGAPGGKGDEVKATLAVSGGSTLDVCVDVGGAAGGTVPKSTPSEPTPTNHGGEGGGASGVSQGSDFSTPALVAGGGGGGGENFLLETRNGAQTVEGGEGGSAGKDGQPGSPFEAGSEGGAGGKTSGGSASNSAGPGSGAAGQEGGNSFETAFGSAGGGGGGGFVGGGGGHSGFATSSSGGGGGGGAGGTDFCGGTGVSGCTTTPEAGTGTGSVTLTYTVPATLPTSKDQCKKDGWKSFGATFRNQGQCVSFVEHENHAARFSRRRHRG